MLGGTLPPRALTLVAEWDSLHEVELLENWRRLHADEPPAKIARLEQPMLPRITQVEVVGAFRVALTFTDGSVGVADVGPWIAGRGGVFAALQDSAFFGRVRVDVDAGTLVWPNGADLDPDMLYEAAHAMTAGELPRAVT